MGKPSKLKMTVLLERDEKSMMFPVYKKELNATPEVDSSTPL